MKALRILFYHDSEDFFSPCSDYGTDELKRFLDTSSNNDCGSREKGAKKTFGVTIEVETCFRGEGDQLKRIDDCFLEDFHEIWFFLKKYEGKGKLDDGEVDALRRWMDKGGGVLITGDHAVVSAGRSLGIGGVIGQKIPRAGHLRNWTYPRIGIEHIDSTVAQSMFGPSRKQLERDGIPQKLLLPAVGQAKTYHPIFYGAFNRVLDVFPDHRHEGVVKLPTKYGHEWCAEGGSSCKPPEAEIIARGIDQSRLEVYDLMAAWDGHEVGVGRILSDSSWHHYVNLNLWELLGGDSGDDSVATKMKNLYINQAIWLAPEDIRLEIAGCLVNQFSSNKTKDPLELKLEDWHHSPLASRISAPMFIDILRGALRPIIPKGAGSISNESLFLTFALRELIRLKTIADGAGQKLTKGKERKALCAGLYFATTQLETKLRGYERLRKYLEQNPPA